jgi:DNA-binding NarL/FixJ family response regulator
MEKLADGIRIVMNGGSLITPKVATKAFHLFSQLARDICRECPNHPVAGEFNLLPCPFPENLSRTEFRIIYYIGQGLSNQEIAEKICRKTGTVRNYISMILQKTSLRNRTQIALLALQNGIAQGVSGERSRCMNYRI